MTHAWVQALLDLANKVLSRFNARLRGIRGSVPLGSVIRGKTITIGDGFYASGTVWIEAVVQYEDARFQPTVDIGAGVRSSPRLHISSNNKITIGPRCLFGENVFISDHSHGSTRGEVQTSPEVAPSQRALTTGRPVSVGPDCHLGNNVVVLPGVTIGAGAIVGANSVVSHDVPPRSIVVGAPARVLKRWSPVLQQWTADGC